MGGDEFVLVLPGARAGELNGRFEQLRSVISQVSQEMFSGDLLSISIGTAYYPEDGADAEELLSVADRRMYSEKHSHREQVDRVFASGARTRTRRQRAGELAPPHFIS